MYLKSPNYMQIELGTKKVTLRYCILKLCSVLSTPNHATVSNKDQSDFYKGIDGNAIKRIEHIIQSQSQMHYTFSPPTHLCYQAETPITPLNYFPGPFPINYLTHNPLH